MEVFASAAATTAGTAVGTAGGAVADATGLTGAGAAAGSGGEYGQLLGEADRTATRAFRPPPVAGTDQDFAVVVALVAMKLVNRHEQTIAVSGKSSMAN